MKSPSACAQSEKKNPIVPASDELWLGGTVPESWSSALHFNELKRVS